MEEDTNMVLVDGEWIDGFHTETIPQFNTDNNFDMDALSSIAGMRAVWLLYLFGKWDHLEDLGVDRSEVEPVLSQFNYGRRLTIRQAQQLRKKVPILVEASKELRLAYALKQLDRPGRKGRTMQQSNNNVFIYHAEVATAQEADEQVNAHKAEIEAAGGTIEAGHGARGGGSIVMVKLPARLEVDPANLLSGSGLKFSKVRAQVVSFPKQMGQDPRPRNEKE